MNIIFENLEFEGSPHNPMEREWINGCIKLAENRHQLTLEEEEFILKLIEKLI